MSVTRIQLRRGTASQWASSSDVILAAGEIGFETDTNNFKIGNGEDTWSELAYFKNVDKLNNPVDGDLDSYATVASLSSYIQNNKIGVINGVASLDSSGQVPISQLGNIINGAPESLDTLNEIAQALQDDETGLDALLTEINKKVSDTGDTIKGDLIVENSDSPGTGTGKIIANTLRLLSTGEADATSTTHAFQIGADNDTKLKIDQNEIQALTSTNATNTLSLNPAGGQVNLGLGAGGILAVSNTGVSSSQTISTSGTAGFTIGGTGTFSGSGASLTNIPLSGLATASRDTAATANTLVLRDANADFSARNITSNGVLLSPSRYFVLKSLRSLTSNTAAQSIFGVGTTLEANRSYEVEICVSFTRSTGVTATTSFQLSSVSGITFGTNVSVYSQFLGIAANGTATAPLNKWFDTTSPTTTLTLNSTAVSTAGGQFIIKALINTSSGGVLNPTIAFSNAVAPVIQQSSYIKITDAFTGTNGTWTV